MLWSPFSRTQVKKIRFLNICHHRHLIFSEIITTLHKNQSGPDLACVTHQLRLAYSANQFWKCLPITIYFGIFVIQGKDTEHKHTTLATLASLGWILYLFSFQILIQLYSLGFCLFEVSVMVTQLFSHTIFKANTNHTMKFDSFHLNVILTGLSSYCQLFLIFCL